MRRLLYSLIPVIAAAVWSCEYQSPDYSAFADIDPRGWLYGDTVVLRPGLPDSISSGRLAVTLRHTDAYDFSNLWVEITVPYADTVQVDTLDIRLADVYGRWYGRGVGVSYLTADTLPGRYTITTADSINIRHIMRVDTLTEIEQIGLIFIPE